jgi:predicted SnoaL-like aldol condensation-catalyzing enzyme
MEIDPLRWMSATIQLSVRNGKRLRRALQPLVDAEDRFADVSSFAGRLSRARCSSRRRGYRRRNLANNGNAMTRTVIPGLLAAALLAAPADAGPAENKQLVASFIREVFVEKNPDAARKYLATDYIQHNPHVAPGADGFVSSIREWFSHAPEDLGDQTLHLVAEGDLVVAHQQLTYTSKDGTKKQAVGFDLYRVKDGRIVEHWDSDE